MAKKANDVLDLYEVLRTAQGRRVMCGVLNRLGYWSNTFHADPYQHAKLAGSRGHALDIAEQIEREFPEYWMTMLRERMEERNPQQQSKRDDDNDDTSN